MSLEFAIDHPCVLRARYSEQHLREWGRLGNLHTILTTGDQNAPSADKLKWIEDSGDEIESLQRETVVCADCPACLPLEIAGEGEAVGCLGRINYPIDAQFENFWPIGFSSSWILSITKTSRVCFTFSLIPNRRLTVKRPKNCG